MIDIEANTLTVGGKTYPIEKWEVWFVTPFGLCDSQEAAVERCRANDLDPNTCVHPTAVATALSRTIYLPR